MTLSNIFRGLGAIALVMSFLILPAPVAAVVATETLNPDSPGDYTQLTVVYPLPPFTAPNWQVCADNILLTLVSSTGNVWQNDLYNLSDVSLTGTIKSVTVHIQARATYSQTQTGACTSIRTGSSDYFGTEIALTTSWATYSTTYTINPNTSAPWTWDQINSLQAGVSSRRSRPILPDPSLTTKVWVTVDYCIPPQVEAGDDQEVCEDASPIPLTGCNPAGGIWSGPGVSGSNFDPAGLDSDNYSIMYYYTDSDGCSNSDNKTVTVNTLPDCAITLDSSSVCTYSTGHTAQVTPVSGATYNWSITDNGTITSIPPYTNSITWDATGAGTATIDITISDANGCSCTNGGQTVTVNRLPACNISCYPDDCVACAGDNVTLRENGGDAASWSWSTGATTQSIVVSTSGNYSVTITDQNGCHSTCQKQVTINPRPTATASSNSPVCAGTTIQLTGGPGSMALYSWTGPNGFNSPLQSPSINNATLAMAGTYILTVTNSYGCTDNKTTTVIINSAPVAVAGSNSPVCYGAVIQLVGLPGGMTYSWTGPNGFTSNQESPSIINAAPAMTGTYTLTVTDRCGSSGATTSVNVINCTNQLITGGGGGGNITFAPPPTGGVTCPLTLTVNMLGQITTAKMTANGVLCENCLAFDPPKQNSWEAQAGTHLTLDSGKVPLLIKVTTVASSPSTGPSETIGQTFDINAYASLNSTIPSPISISPLFTMASAYDPNALPKNTSQVIFSYYPNPSQGWLAMGSEGVVAAVGEARGTLNYFVPDTLLAKLAEIKAAKFQASALAINPTRVPPNQQIMVSVNVANTGGSSGNYTVELKVDGIVKSTKNITLAAGASQLVSFNIAESAVGKYQIEIAGLTGEFVVAGPSKINWWLIGGIIAAIILALGIWMLMRWRRFSS